MPYTKVSDLPAYVPATKATAWMAKFNDTYAAAILGGSSKDEAEQIAFKAANKIARERSNTMRNERRVFSTGNVLRAELRDSGKMTLAGYAAVFNSRTKIGGLFHELLSRGCFRDALKTSDARAFWNHQQDGIPLGRQSAGTLRLAEDYRGLSFELDVPDTTQGRDLWTAVRRADVNSMSFSFAVDPNDDDAETWDDNFTCDDQTCCARDAKKNIPLRTINRVSYLGEVSAVNYPAYKAANVKATVEDLSEDHDPLDEAPDGTDEDASENIAYAGGTIVPVEVRARARAATRGIKRNRSDADRLAILKAYNEQRDKDNRRRINEATKAILLSDTVRALDLSSVTAKEVALEQDIANLRQAAEYILHPSSYPGSCENYLRWLKEWRDSH